MAYNPYLSKTRQNPEKPKNTASPTAPQAAVNRGPAGQQQVTQERSPHGGQTSLPNGYLAGGYFDQDGNIKPELLTDHAYEIARAIGQPPAGIANAQLRKFYGHVRVADTRMRYEVPFATVRASILELAGFVAEARGKNKVPQVFKDFIDLNLANIKDEKTFRQGFVKHFQAVVGYFSFICPVLNINSRRR